jgi:hypothetical protein
MTLDIENMLSGDITTMLEVFDLVKRVEKIELSPGYDKRYELKELLHKKEISSLMDKISSLEKQIESNNKLSYDNDIILQNRIIKLEEYIQNNTIHSTKIIISTIEEITYSGDYEYDGSEFDSYLVKLYNNNSYFYLSVRKNCRIKPPKIGDEISHVIEGNRIREWRRLKK